MSDNVVALVMSLLMGAFGGILAVGYTTMSKHDPLWESDEVYTRGDKILITATVITFAVIGFTAVKIILG